MQPLTFILASLAVFRLSRMIADEEGPWAIFLNLRKAYPPTNWFGRGLECIMCLSVWVALPIACYIDGTWTAPLTWLAVSAVTVLLREWKNKR
jgi:hypothetical protein